MKKPEAPSSCGLCSTSPRNLLWGYILTPNGMCTVTHKTHLRPRVPPAHTEGPQAKGEREGHGAQDQEPALMQEVSPGPEGGSNPSHPPNTPHGLSGGRKGTQEQCHSPPPAPPLTPGPRPSPCTLCWSLWFLLFFRRVTYDGLQDASLTDAGKQRQGGGATIPSFPSRKTPFVNRKHQWDRRCVPFKQWLPI